MLLLRRKQMLSNEDYLWHLIYALDRAAIMSFFFLWNEQDTHVSPSHRYEIYSEWAWFIERLRVCTHWRKNFNPNPYIDDNEACGHRWGGNSGLFNMHVVFPGVVGILDFCLKCSKIKQVWLHKEGPLLVLAWRLLNLCSDPRKSTFVRKTHHACHNVCLRPRSDVVPPCTPEAGHMADR